MTSMLQGVDDGTEPQAAPLQMRVARAFVQTEEEHMVETVVETPSLGTGKLLLGRAVLNSLSLLLDGPAKVTYPVKPADAC
jgi:hypothetical protein